MGAYGTVEVDEAATVRLTALANGVSAALDAVTTLGRIDNALKNDGGAADPAIQATTSHDDIVARSL